MADPPVEKLPADFGKYRLEKRIATGGMAEIFLAHRRDEPMRPVVIKRILPHLGKNAEFVQMFLDEARIAGQLRHTNVVGIEDIGQLDGAYFIAMEYLHGEDIRRIYNRAYRLQRSLPLSHSIRVVADAALGLGYAHKLTDVSGRPLRMVHRDVSPQNILVTYEGDAKVVDFGIAKAINKVAQTRAGVLKGKYSYMSPEQALGEEVDHRTDIFALGIILYETTTGTRLFKQKNELATLQTIIKCEFVLPSEALHNYPPALEKILLKALAKNREERFNDADEFSAALYDFLYDSGLYVERDEIAAFMKDLFADRLEEEDGSGVPAVPSPEEAREELAEAVRADRGEQLHPEVATRAYGARTQESPPAEALQYRDHTDPETNARASSDLEATEDAQSQRRKSTYVVRRKVPEMRLGSDQAPTVAIPSYAEGDQELPSAAWRGPTAPIGPENTDREGASVVEAPRRSPSSRWGETLRRPAWMAGVVGLTLLIVTLSGILVFRAGRTPSPQPASPGVLPVLELARLTVHTEPGADVYVQGELIGTADATGQAGPYPVAPGDVLIRVQHLGLGFERQRPLSIEPGQNYQFEINGRPGFLRIAAAPWARVQVDGRQMGLTPLPRLSLLEGVHEVELVNPDIRRRYRGVVRIIAGEVAVLKVNLQERGEGL